MDDVFFGELVAEEVEPGDVEVGVGFVCLVVVFCFGWV